MPLSIDSPEGWLRERVSELLPESLAASPAQDLRVVCVQRVSRTSLRAAGLLDDRPTGVRRVAVIGQLPSPHGMRVLAAQLDGVVLAERLDETLVITLEAVARGQHVMPGEFEERLRRPELSAREKQILALVVLDASNAEIAQRLFVTESAVKNHLTSAFGKLGVRSRAAAAELISDPEGGLGLGVLRITPDSGTAENAHAAGSVAG